MLVYQRVYGNLHIRRSQGVPPDRNFFRLVRSEQRPASQRHSAPQAQHAQAQALLAPRMGGSATQALAWQLFMGFLAGKIHFLVGKIHFLAGKIQSFIISSDSSSLIQLFGIFG